MPVQWTTKVRVSLLAVSLLLPLFFWSTSSLEQEVFFRKLPKIMAGFALGLLLGGLAGFILWSGRTFRLVLFWTAAIFYALQVYISLFYGGNPAEYFLVGFANIGELRWFYAWTLLWILVAVSLWVLARDVVWPLLHGLVALLHGLVARQGGVAAPPGLHAGIARQEEWTAPLQQPIVGEELQGEADPNIEKHRDVPPTPGHQQPLPADDNAAQPQTTARSGLDDYQTQIARDEALETGANRPINEDWATLAQYYPEVETYASDLRALSPALAEEYQSNILETKAPNDAKKVSNALREQFLEAHFGPDSEIQSFVLLALRAKRRDVALEVNRAIRISGLPLDATRFLGRVSEVTYWPAKSPSQTQPDPSSLLVGDVAPPKTGALVFASLVILLMVGLSLAVWTFSRSEEKEARSNAPPQTSWATVPMGSNLYATRDGYVWRSGVRIGWVDQAALAYYRFDQIEEVRGSPVPKAGAIGERFSIGELGSAVERTEKVHGSTVYKDNIEYEAVVKTDDGFVWSAGRQIGFVQNSTFYRLGQVDASPPPTPRPGATGVAIDDGNLSDAVRRAYAERK